MSVHLSSNIHSTDCWIDECTFLMCRSVSFWSVFVFTLITNSFPVSVIYPFLPHLFIYPCLLSFPLPHPCLFFHAFSVPVFLSVSLDYLSLSSREPSLTRSPWSSRAHWRESWIWWTTCPALSATTTRCPPGLASTTSTRRSIIARLMTHSLHFMCRAAHMIQENEKQLQCSPYFEFDYWKCNMQTIVLSFTQPGKIISAIFRKFKRQKKKLAKP